VTYILNRSQNAIRKAAFEFAKGEFAKGGDGEAARNLDRNGIFPEAIWAKAAELGFIGIHHGEKYGGGGMGLLENILIAEVLATRDSSLGSAIMLSGLAAEWLVRFGTKIQKETLLPDIYEGRKKTGFACGSFNEGGVLSLKMTAFSENLQVTGDIANVINGKNADILLVLCDHFDPDKPTDNCSMLIIDRAQSGVTMGDDYSLLGLRPNGMTGFHLNNVEIKASNFINKITRGHNQYRSAQTAFYLLMAALALGTAQGAFDRALAHVKGREQFGKKLAGFQITQHKLARMAIQIEQSRCLTYEAAKKADPKMSIMANMASASTAVSVSFEAIQLLGGYGYTNEYDVERCYRDAKTLQILSGHEHDLLDQISARIIGKLKK